MRRVVLLLLASCLSTPFVAGCGDEATAPREAVTVTQVTTQTITAQAPDRRVQPTGASAPASTRSRDADDSRITVPDVVGKDHQYAQDTMQAAGLYNLAEEDATGQDRLLLWDRNWVVVSQSPPAGARVNADTTIVLRSKKDGE